MVDTLFTRIVNGDIPSYKIYEDEHTYAFLDIHPVQPGHTLVIPKLAVPSVWDLPIAEYDHLMRAVQKVALRLRQVSATPYVGQQIVGLDVPHAHVHLIPFTVKDEFTRQPDESLEPDHPALAALAKKLAF